VYDMYYWDQPGQDALNGAKRPSRPVRGIRHHLRPAGGPHRGHPAPAGRGPGAAGRGTGAAGPASPAAQAVQVALDRRDNGGDSSARRDQ